MFSPEEEEGNKDAASCACRHICVHKYDARFLLLSCSHFALAQVVPSRTAAIGLLAKNTTETTTSAAAAAAHNTTKRLAESVDKVANHVGGRLLHGAESPVGYALDRTDGAVGRVSDASHGAGGVLEDRADRASDTADYIAQATQVALLWLWLVGYQKK